MQRLSYSLLALFACQAAQEPEVQQTVTTTQPNIVVVMADDLDVALLDDLLARGRMPYMKRHVIDRGMRFVNSFVTNSLCCPSRATYLTGQYSHNTGVHSNYPPTGGISAFHPASTVTTWLRAANYRTAHVGKFLNGYATWAPEGFEGQPWQYVPPDWDEWHGLNDPTTYYANNYLMTHKRFADAQPTRKFYGASAVEYQTDVLGAIGRDVIERMSAQKAIDGKPFFLSVTPLAPHVDARTMIGNMNTYLDEFKWTIPPAPRHVGQFASVIPPFLDKSSFNELYMTDKPKFMERLPRLNGTAMGDVVKQYRDRMESMLAVDDLVGGLVAQLAAAGQLEDTIIVFTSDNGFLYGEHRTSEKLYAYEESIRVPLFIAVPPKFLGTPPANRYESVNNTDLAPTIAALAGATALDVDGRSLVPLLAGQVPPWRKRFLVEHWHNQDPTLVGPIDVDIPDFAAVRTHVESDPALTRRLYVEFPPYTYNEQLVENDRELYDLDTDPLEERSRHLVAAEQAVIAQLHAKLVTLQACAGQSCRDAEQ